MKANFSTLIILMLSELAQPYIKELTTVSGHFNNKLIFSLNRTSNELAMKDFCRRQNVVLIRVPMSVYRSFVPSFVFLIV